jgi:hypothetical protein
MFLITNTSKGLAEFLNKDFMISGSKTHEELREENMHPREKSS